MAKQPLTPITTPAKDLHIARISPTDPTQTAGNVGRIVDTNENETVITIQPRSYSRTAVPFTIPASDLHQWTEVCGLVRSSKTTFNSWICGNPVKTEGEHKCNVHLGAEKRAAAKRQQQIEESRRRHSVRASYEDRLAALKPEVGDQVYLRSDRDGSVTGQVSIQIGTLERLIRELRELRGEPTTGEY